MSRQKAIWGWVGLGLVALTGCGRDTYPVEGTLEVQGDVSALAGSIIEAAVDGDPERRASGEIQPDGTFVLETLKDGRIRKGVREGTYRVRIIPSDDDRQVRRRVLSTVGPRYLKFQTSGMTLTVPTNEAVVFKAGKS